MLPRGARVKTVALRLIRNERFDLIHRRWGENLIIIIAKCTRCEFGVIAKIIKPKRRNLLNRYFGFQ